MNSFYKNLKYITYISQISMSMIIPIFICLYLGNLIKNFFGLGNLVSVLFILIGVLSGFYNVSKTVNYLLTKEDKNNDDDNV
ncbi:MAG: AtpZ/AtpI family protein [Oscillospiraceae bacterium]